MTDYINELDESLGQLFHVLKSHTTWKKIISETNLSLDRPSLGILHVLLQQKSNIRLNDLAKILEIEAPYLSRKTKELEDMGLIKRKHSDNDRREIYLEVTEKASKIVESFSLARKKNISKALKGWSDSDQKSFAILLKKFVNNMKELN